MCVHLWIHMSICVYVKVCANIHAIIFLPVHPLLIILTYWFTLICHDTHYMLCPSIAIKTKPKLTNSHPKVIWITRNLPEYKKLALIPHIFLPSACIQIIINLPAYTKLALIPHIVLPQRVYTEPPTKNRYNIHNIRWNPTLG